MLNCPLNPDLFLQSARPMGLSHLQAIEDHISSVNNCPHPPMKEFIFDGLVKGTTPLLLACQCGEFKSVKRIVETWVGIDVRDAATFYLHLLPNPLDPHAGLFKIESATPLFVAAYQGYSKIVRYLLEKGADVTTKTSDEAEPEYDGLSPLDGVVSEHWTPKLHQPLDEQRAERNAIVLSLLEFGADLSASNKPIWINQWCRVEMTITLINHGMDVKQYDPSLGRTILHHWASPPHDLTEEDSLKIVKLLIEKGADLMARNNYGFTPIMTAAIGRGTRLYLSLLEFLLERDDIAIMEKIEAMELAGAKILSNPDYARLKAFEYWRRATRLRQTEGSDSYQKKLVKKSLGSVEWTTSDQLERAIQHPTESEIKIQSLLVQLRILSSRSWGALNYFLVSFMYSSDWTFNADEEELLDIHWAVLDSIHLFQSRENRLRDTSARVVCAHIYMLSNCKNFNPTLLNLEIIKKSVHHILAMDKSIRLAYPDTRIEPRYSRAIFRFLEVLLGQSEMLDDILWGSLSRLFRHLGSDQLGSLLLPACKDYKNAHYSVIIRILLRLGANVDTADKDGNRPLHLVAQAESEQSETAGCLLLGYGAQLHRTNNSGKTAVDLCIERNENDQERKESSGRPDWCRTVSKLRCLSARCIRVHNVPYEDEPEFFQDSHSFIKKH